MVTINAVVVILAPLGGVLDRRDFDLHYAALTDVVERVEAWRNAEGAPYVKVVNLPKSYPLSLSSVGGQRGFIVFREGETLYVMFTPFSGIAEKSAIVYRSDGEPLALESPDFYNALRYEPLADRWYRGVFNRWAKNTEEALIDLILRADHRCPWAPSKSSTENSLHGRRDTGVICVDVIEILNLVIQRYRFSGCVRTRKNLAFFLLTLYC